MSASLRWSLAEQRWGMFLLIMFGGTVMNLLVDPFWGALRNLNYPANTFLFRPEAMFSDLVDFYVTFSRDGDPYLGTAVNPHRVYYPFAYLVGRSFSIIPANLLNLVQAGLALGFLLYLAHCATAGRRLSVRELLLISASILVSYPFAFAFDRGNPEFLIVGLVALFAALIIRQRWQAALIPLAMAIAMKGIPVVLLLLYVREKRYLQVAMGTVLAVLFTVVATGYFLNSTDIVLWGAMWERLFANQHAFINYYGYGTEGILFGSSLFGLGKYLLMTFWPMTFGSDVLTLRDTYTFVVLALVALVVVAMLTRRFSPSNSLQLLLLLTILLPYSAGDYKLLVLFVPLVIKMVQQEIEVFQLVLYALLFMPKAYFSLSALPEAHISVLVNPILMLILLFSTLRQPGTS